ncbi:MAG: dihydroorotase [Nitritalea sp.]
MTLLIKNLRMVDAQSVHSPQDYFFDGNHLFPLQQYPDRVPADTPIYEANGCLGSEAWTDLRTLAGDPGLEQKDTLEDLLLQLAHSGFKQAVLLPNTKPVLQTKNDIAYVQQKAAHSPVTLNVMAAATKDCLGEDFTELHDLAAQGVRVFGDGLHTLHHPDRLLRVLQYITKFKGVCFDQSIDPLLSLYGHMHEGFVSTQLGIKGIPALAEELAIQRNIKLCGYAAGRLHFQTVSTAAGVQLIRQAKADGLAVTADCSIYQLLFTDEDLRDFDANYKVMPPFRAKADQEALLEGLLDGTIDALVSNHVPHEADAKVLEFDYAAFGMLGIQTFAPALGRLAERLGWPLLIEKITSGPAKVLGQTPSTPDRLDSLTIWDPEDTWTFDATTNLSKSKNSPYYGQTLKGAVRLLLHKGIIVTPDVVS